MSDQRRYRSELKQGLHQFLMQLYMSYADNHDSEEAKALIIEILEEQYLYFEPEDLKTKMVSDVISEKIADLNDLMEQSGDYDSQAYYAEKIDALQSAVDALAFKIR